MNGFKSVMEYLGLHTYKNFNDNKFKLTFENIKKENIFSKSFMDQIMSKLYYRNTKNGSGKEVIIPPILEEVIMLDLTPIEKSIYKTSLNEGELYLRQICCHPQISDKDIATLGANNLSLGDVKLKLIKHNETQKIIFENKLREILNDEDKIETHKVTIKNYKNKISEYNFLIKMFTNLDPMKPSDGKDDICSVCMCDFENPVITKCGHKFCKECLETVLNTARKNCPVCRKVINSNDMFKLGRQKELNIDPLTYKYGSKMGKLISLCNKINSNPDNRMIIFSQWDRMLIKISETLQEQNIDSVFCKGNVYQRNKAIRTFKQGLIRKKNPVRIIMLSTKNAASGINLNEANYIIFVDPIDGTSEEIKAIRNQALGRTQRINQDKQVRVIDLIIKNTIEEVIHNKRIK